MVAPMSRGMIAPRRVRTMHEIYGSATRLSASPCRRTPCLAVSRWRGGVGTVRPHRSITFRCPTILSFSL